MFSLHLLKVWFQAVDPADLMAVLTWIVFGGGSVWVVNQLASLLAANWKWFADLPGNVKFLIFLVLAPVLALGANLLLGYTDLIGTIQPYWQIVVMAILGYLGGQKQYQQIKATNYGKA